MSDSGNGLDIISIDRLRHGYKIFILQLQDGMVHTQ